MVATAQSSRTGHQVVFFNPSATRVYGGLKGIAFPPIGLITLASVLVGEGISAIILDEALLDLGGDEALDGRLGGAMLAGITVTTPTLKAGLALAERIRRVRPELPIVLGGVHATLAPREVFASAAVDFVVEGEGEQPLLALVRALLEGRAPGLVPGLWRRGAGGAPEAGPPPRRLEDLDTLPPPDFNLLADTSYGYPDSLTAPVLPLITSRGCPGRCTFCNALSLWGTRLRQQSAEKVVADIRHLVEHHGAREIHFWDDNFITSKQRMRECARLMREQKLRVRIAFPSGVRVDFVDEERIAMLAEMGAYSFALGVESGSQRILDEMRKHISLERIERAMAVLKAARMETWAFFLFGMPGETVESAEESIRFALRIDPDIAKFHILKPYPGSEVARVLSERGHILHYNYEEYGIHLTPVHRTDALSPEDLLRIQEDAYRRFYLRPGKIVSEIRRNCRSWHRIRVNAPVAWRLFAAKMLRRG